MKKNMAYLVDEDLILIRNMLNLTQENIASKLGVDFKTINRIENGETYPSLETIDRIYSFAFINNIKLNSIKEMLYKEEYSDSLIVFHGSKSGINGEISPFVGKESNDFGSAFYCGESISQAVSFVANRKDSHAYILRFKNYDKLKCATFNVDEEWILAIAYYRGKLESFKENKIIKSIINKVESSDYIYAPIADNRMYMIISDFVDGLITDEQCKHSLAATNLGKQYIFKSEAATRNLEILEECYLSTAERNNLIANKTFSAIDRENKVKYSLIKYANKGKRIEEILK